MKNTKKKEKKKEIQNLDQNFEKLLALGKKKGYLTYEEINDFLPEEIISADQIEKVFAVLDREKIEITDSEEEFEMRHKE
jgi:RNA polymerase primary sigma factor